MSVLGTQKEVISLNIQISKSIDVMNNLMPIHKIIWNQFFSGKNQLSKLSEETENCNNPLLENLNLLLEAFLERKKPRPRWPQQWVLPNTQGRTIPKLNKLIQRAGEKSNASQLSKDPGNPNTKTSQGH